MTTVAVTTRDVLHVTELLMLLSNRARDFDMGSASGVIVRTLLLGNGNMDAKRLVLQANEWVTSHRECKGRMKR